MRGGFDEDGQKTAPDRGEQTEQLANERSAPTSTVLYRKEYTREALAFFSVVATTGAAWLRKKRHF